MRLQDTAETYLGQALCTMVSTPAIVAAAGASSRCPEGKLLKHWRGKPLLAWLLEKLVEHRRIGGIVVVTGHHAPAVEALALSYPRVDTVFNPLWSQGLSTSLRRGVERLPDGSPFLVALGDTPLFKAETLDQILPSIGEQEQEVRVPTLGDQQGHPVFFPAWTRTDWSLLKGDSGARPLMRRWGDRVRLVPVEDEGVLRDFDLASDFREVAGL